MARFHVNNAGDTGTCKAGKDNCPFGGPDEHYSTREEAETVAEKKLEKQYGLVNSVYKSGAGDTSRLDSMSTDMKKRIVMDSASGKNRIHPSVAAKVFSKDKDELVRRRVAENVKSQNMLRKMSSDESPKVREAVARSTNNPNALRELAKDDDPKVRNAALKNERIPKRDKKKTIEAIKKAAVAKRRGSASKKS